MHPLKKIDTQEVIQHRRRCEQSSAAERGQSGGEKEEQARGQSPERSTARECFFSLSNSPMLHRPPPPLRRGKFPRGQSGGDKEEQARGQSPEEAPREIASLVSDTPQCFANPGRY
ncbi:importin alpha isoform 4 [Actinidia rufa]|uniref:Importin alpha isoform 4 n=1 Tax=Actinidia rufa TaxID=165716 RepID=A0A7J0H958_9ERIC|nr:importin alpha isoform 4 [Actinidia rufa]